MKLQNEQVLVKKGIKLFVLYYTNIDKAKIFPALHSKVALLMRRGLEWGNKKSSQKNF